jgi:hypothetical protein
VVHDRPDTSLDPPRAAERPETSDAVHRLTALLEEEAEVADESPAGRDGRLLRHLAETMDRMTPAERTWVEQASEGELRGFARALRLGCPPEEPG